MPAYGQNPKQAEQALHPRQVFTDAIQRATDPDRIAKLEILREWFTNPDFRQALADYSWKATQGLFAG